MESILSARAIALPLCSLPNVKLGSIITSSAFMFSGRLAFGSETKDSPVGDAEGEDAIEVSTAADGAPDALGVSAVDVAWGAEHAEAKISAPAMPAA